MQEIWGSEHAKKVKLAFVQTGTAYALDSFRSTQSTLDNYANNWIKMHKQACEATRVHGSQSEKLLDQRMICLDQCKRELWALVSILTTADSKVVHNSVQASQNLPSIERCSDVVSLSSAEDLPQDQNTRKFIEKIQTQVAHAKALRQTGKFKLGLKAAQTALTEAKQLGYKPIIVEALVALSDSLDDLGDYKTSENLLFDAFFEAMQTNNDTLWADIANSLVFEIGYRQSRLGEAKMVSKIAFAAIERVANNNSLKARWHRNMGILLAQSNPVKTYQHFQKARKLIEKTKGADNLQFAKALTSLCIVQRTRQELLEAEQYCENSLSIMQKHLGSQHPELALILNTLANIYKDRGELSKAQSTYERALSIYESVSGKKHPTMGVLWLNLANLQLQKKDYDTAHQHYERALAICTQKTCIKEHTAQIHFELAMTLVAKGQDQNRAHTLALSALKYYSEMGLAKDQQQVKRWLFENGFDAAGGTP